MQSLNKRAISNIISTVLLIILSVTAVSILFSSFRTILTKPDLAPQISCLEMQSKSVLEISKACYNSQTQDIEITLKRSPLAGEINSIEFIIKSDSISDKYIANPRDCPSCAILSPGDVKTYFFKEPDFKENTQVKLYSSSCDLMSRKIILC